VRSGFQSGHDGLRHFHPARHLHLGEPGGSPGHNEIAHQGFSFAFSLLGDGFIVATFGRGPIIHVEPHLPLLAPDHVRTGLFAGIVSIHDLLQ
jgi:hypothetical protein